MDETTAILAPFVWLFCFCPLGLAFMGAIAGFAILMNRSDPKTNEAFQLASEGLGLTFVAHKIGYPHLEGTLDGRRVRVTASKGRIGNLEGGSGSRPAVTGYHASHSREDIGWISFQRRKKGRVTFRKETAIGDPEIDEMYAVYTSQPDIAKAIISDPDLKERFLTLENAFVSIDKRSASVIGYGVEKDPDVIQDQVRLAVAISDLIDTTKTEAGLG